MARPCILVADDHPEDLRLLEVSLKNAGFAVTTATTGRDALRKVEISPPDLIISETLLPEMDGFALLQALKEHGDWSAIPFLFLSEERSVEHKVRGLELGVADYLTKPVFVKELIARLRLILQRKERERLEGRSTKTRFAGSLDDIGLVDLIQTIDLSKKTGVLRLSRGSEVGVIYFQDGEIVDGEVGRHRGVGAVYRLLTWSQGLFDVDFRPVRRERMVRLSCQEILMEGMRRLDEWGRLVEQLPSLDTVFIVDAGELMERLDEIPDEANAIIRLTDGTRTLNEIVDSAQFDDLDTLKIITKLAFYGILVDTGRRATPAARAEFSYAREVEGLPEPAFRPSGFPLAEGGDLTGRIAQVSDQVAIGRPAPQTPPGEEPGLETEPRVGAEPTPATAPLAAAAPTAAAPVAAAAQPPVAEAAPPPVAAAAQPRVAEAAPPPVAAAAPPLVAEAAPPPVAEAAPPPVAEAAPPSPSAAAPAEAPAAPQAEQVAEVVPTLDASAAREEVEEPRPPPRKPAAPEKLPVAEKVAAEKPATPEKRPKLPLPPPPVSVPLEFKLPPLPPPPAKSALAETWPAGGDAAGPAAGEKRPGEEPLADLSAAAQLGEKPEEARPSTLRVIGAPPVKPPEPAAEAPAPLAPPPRAPEAKPSTLRFIPSPASSVVPERAQAPGPVGRVQQRLTPEHLDAMAARFEARSPFVRPSEVGASMPPPPPGFRLATEATPVPGSIMRADLEAAAAAARAGEQEEKIEIVFGDAEPKVIVDMAHEGAAALEAERVTSERIAAPRRSAGGVIAGVVVAVAVIAGGLYLLVYRDRGERERAPDAGDATVALAPADARAGAPQPEPDVSWAAPAWEDDAAKADVPLVAPAPDAGIPADVPASAEAVGAAAVVRDAGAVEAAPQVAAVEAVAAADAAVPAPAVVGAPDPEAAAAAMADARRAWRAGDHDAALARMRDAARLDPFSVKPALQWGRWVVNSRLYSDADRCREAAAFLEPTAQAHPGEGELWFYYATFLYRSGDRQAGDAAKARCIEIRPANDYVQGCRYLPE